MRRILTFVIAPVLVLGGLALCNAPAMAQGYHPYYVHKPVPGYPATWWRNEARRDQARLWRAAHYRAAHYRAAHDRAAHYRWGHHR